VNPLTKQIYAAHFYDSSVTVIDGALHTTTVPAGQLPTAVAVNPVTNKVYVATTSQIEAR